MKEDPLSSEPLVEPLTRREGEILALLAGNLTGPEIAEKLTLAVSSVRWHIQQIYGKLGVNGKRQAVARARELGLLRSESPASGAPEPRPGQALPTGADPFLTRAKHNLPLQLTSFIGREKEIAEVQALVHKTQGRLVTLTGSGGVGKTRLALQAAAGLMESFPDGAWLVELAPLADPERVAQAAAAALDVRETPGRPAAVALADYLRAKHLLLILDNCEHVISACAELAHHLLQACSGLHILATSRERLGVPGETAFHVPSLSTPGAQEPLDLETARQYETVRLFVDRAHSASPAFILTEVNAQAVAQICQRLDGIPLAIELAAARVRFLSVGQIAARLDDAFRLLAGGSRTALPRQQTLRASIDWSYNLLIEQEQSLLQRLSVFAGGWTLEAAEAVCPGEEVLDCLGQLVDKSLALARPGTGSAETRYRMLETIRQYAGEKLAESGASGPARDRHLAYFLQFAEGIEPELRGRHQKARLDQLEEELDNLRLALTWALQTDLDTELRLASALKWFWHMHSRHLEGLEWLEPGLARLQALGDPGSPTIQPALQAKALTAAGALHAMAFRTAQAETELEESLRIYPELGSERKTEIADTLYWHGNNEFNKDQYSQAVALLREGLALSREIKDPFGTAKHLSLLSASLEKIDPGNLEARQIIKEALALFLETGDLDGIATAYHYMGYQAFNDRDLARAKFLFEQSLSFYQQVGNRVMVSFSLIYLGLNALGQGDFPAAVEYYRAAVAIQRDIASPGTLAVGLIQMGLFRLFEGNHGLARRCLEESLALCQETGDQYFLTFNHLLLGKLAWAEGDRELARRKLADALAAGQKGIDPDLTANLLTFQSTLAWAGGDEKGAETGLKEALKTAGKINPEMYGASWALDKLAQMQARCQPDRAARLFGAVEHLHWSYAQYLDPAERAGRQAALAQVRTALGEARMAELWAEGQAMTSDQVIAYALDEENGG